MSHDNLHGIDVALAEAFAEHLPPRIREIVRRRCYGCSINHPSQKNHDVCLMMDPEEQIRSCLDEALESVDIREVLVTFRANSNVLVIPLYLESSYWWRRQFNDPCWKELVVSSIMRRSV